MTQRKGETKQEYNARMNELMKAKYRSVRAAHVERMGGRCVDCFSTEGLEFDHIDPSQKLYNVAQIMLHNPDKVRAELDKTVLRCYACHAHYTALQKLQNVNLLPL